jgi:hypothetical protein
VRVCVCADRRGGELNYQALRAAIGNALIDFYWSMNGTHWKQSTNWLQGNPCDEWLGVRCYSNNTAVTMLYVVLSGVDACHCTLQYH